MFMLSSSRHFIDRFVPCVTDPLLLKTQSAMAKRARLAQKVLLFSRRSEIQPGAGSLCRSGFNRNLMNMILKRRGVSRGETSGRETQQYKYNLTTKGRNQRQIK